jgi:hypothetical protein
MRKPHIDSGTVELKFIGPGSRRDEAISALMQLGFTDISDSLPWRQCFPETDGELLPGACLAGARYREGLTQRELSRVTGIPQRHISEMERGKRPIGKEMAKRLAKALHVGYKVFL